MGPQHLHISMLGRFLNGQIIFSSPSSSFKKPILNPKLEPLENLNTNPTLGFAYFP